MDIAGTEKIRILFLIDELMVGGTERQLMLLADSLPLSRFEPIIGVLRENDFSRGLRLRTEIVSFNWSGPPLIKNIHLVRKIRCFLDTRQVDILQTQFIESEIYGSAAAKLSKVNPIVVATRRNLYHWIRDDRLRFRAARQLVRLARAVVANSYSARNACARLENVPAEKITVIPNAVTVDRFNTVACREARRLCGLDPDDLIIGVIGNWRPIKGIDVFLHGAAKVLEAVPAAKFILVGNGPQEKALRALAAQLGIADRVGFRGDSDNIPTLLAAFDIAVQPSRSESFSNVLVEYMAAAKPIVATRVGDAELILDGGRCGRLVEPDRPEELAAEIISLCRDRDAASAIAYQAGKRVSENWSLAMIIEQYRVLYERLFSQRTVGRVREQGL